MPYRDLTLAERQLRHIAALTDSTGGTADDTIAAVAATGDGVDGTGSNAAAKADVDARLATINANLCDLAAKVNAILAAMKKG